MVQRKLACKLGIIKHDSHIKSQSNPKPVSCHHQDIKKPDMKRKMKRSASIKLPDTEKALSLPGKPPPRAAATLLETFQKQPTLKPTTLLATPQKQPILKPTDSSPNYMKSTSSSEARKDGKTLRERFSDKVMKGLAKTSSLKLGRTLTRTPSFKQTRGSNKKCSSRVVLCADDDVQKATCSSTLKDSKFPKYLVLNPGGTEAEGTSVEKVCPYNHCSLNGHHHDPLPPLKGFLKARRQSLKVQRSVKVEALSPRRAKVSSNGRKEDTELLMAKEVDSIVQEAGIDFFVKIYAKGTDQNGFEASYDDIVEGDMPRTKLPRESGKDCDVDSEESGGNNFHVMDMVEGSEESIAEDFYMNGADQALFETDSQRGSEVAYDVSEASHMEWEGQLPTLEIDTEDSDNPLRKFDLVDETELAKSDDVHSTGCAEETLADDMLRDLFEEETESSDSQCIDSDSEIDCLSQAQEDFECSKTTVDQFSFTQGVLEEATTSNGESIEVETDGFPALENSDLMIESAEEVLAAAENVEGDVICESENDIVEGLEDQLEKEFLQVIDATRQIGNSNTSLEEFVKTNAAADVTDKEIQETNSELLPATLSDLSPICFSTDQNVTPVDGNEQEVTDEVSQIDDGTAVEKEHVHLHRRSNTRKEVSETNSSMKWLIGCRKPAEETEEDDRNFNPREPNFLPIIPDPDAEKVDLKHQEMDDRKNSEEWMLDYALRQAVTKLAPARKRKVALLVEAFETVLPEQKYEAQIKHTPTSAFSHTRTIQACS